MNIQFATCERGRALGFLKKLYPSRQVEDTPDSAGEVLNYVEKDIIRIPDPDIHGMRVAVYPSNNWKPELQDEVYSALLRFHDGKPSTTPKKESHE